MLFSSFQDMKYEGHNVRRTRQMQDRKGAGRCKTVRTHDRTDIEQDGCRKGRMQDKTDAGQDGCRTGAMQYRRDVGKKGCWTGGMHDRRGAGIEK